MYDVAIIGGGPAGATLARLLKASLSVVVLDKKKLSQNGNPTTDFSKPCGGLLAPDAQKALSRFNLTLPKSVLVDPQIFAVKTVDTKQDIVKHYQRFYVNMDRHKFDLWLLSLVSDKVTIFDDTTVRHIEKDPEGFLIQYRRGDKEKHSLRAKYVVGTDGSASIVRRKLFPDRKIRQYASIQQWFDAQQQDALYSCIFDSDITNSYCWTISKNNKLLVGGTFPLDSSKQRFELLKSKLISHNAFTFAEQSFATLLRTEGCLVSLPQGIRKFCAGGNDAFLVGEAAGFISPSSLEGISHALNSAYELSRVLNASPHNPSWDYRVNTLPIRLKLLGKYTKHPFMYQPLLRKISMKSGFSSIDIFPGTDSKPAL